MSGRDRQNAGGKNDQLRADFDQARPKLVSSGLSSADSLQEAGQNSSTHDPTTHSHVRLPSHDPTPHPHPTANPPHNSPHNSRRPSSVYHLSRPDRHGFCPPPPGSRSRASSLALGTRWFQPFGGDLMRSDCCSVEPRPHAAQMAHGLSPPLPAPNPSAASLGVRGGHGRRNPTRVAQPGAGRGAGAS